MRMQTGTRRTEKAKRRQTPYEKTGVTEVVCVHRTRIIILDSMSHHENEDGDTEEEQWSTSFKTVFGGIHTRIPSGICKGRGCGETS